MDCNIDIAAHRSAAELRETWQCRALIATRNHYVGMLVLSVLGHNYDDALPVLLRVAFPGFTSIATPFLCTAAKIDKTGAVVADMVAITGEILKDQVLYSDELFLRDEFRKLADELKLNDRDRIEMFKCVQRWVVADRRLDPTMDPRDPDAKRLVLH